MFDLTSCFLFLWNKNIKNVWYIDFLYFFICLKLHSLLLQFYFTRNEVFVFNWKHWKWGFIIFIFWLFLIFIFTENVFRNSTKHIFITIFLFSVKMKIENNQIKHLLNFSTFLVWEESVNYVNRSHTPFRGGVSYTSQYESYPSQWDGHESSQVLLGLRVEYVRFEFDSLHVINFFFKGSARLT